MEIVALIGIALLWTVVVMASVRKKEAALVSLPDSPWMNSRRK